MFTKKFSCLEFIERLSQNKFMTKKSRENGIVDKKMSDIEKFVEEAINELLVRTGGEMNNVVFVIEDEAQEKEEGESSIMRDEVLLGLYEGVPKSERGSGYFGVLPDKITIFRKPLEEMAGGNKARLKRVVFDVVWHEVAHHLGFSEKEICELEAKKRGKFKK